MNFFKGRRFQVGPNATDTGAPIDTATFNFPPHPKRGAIGVSVVEA